MACGSDTFCLTAVRIEMVGEQSPIMAALISPQLDCFKAGGMKYWDGPDDADEGECVSHGCINLDVVNCEMSSAAPLEF
jgi:hypothetical protein